MRCHVLDGALVCRHCGGDLIDYRRFPTGLAHTATGFSRCDGRTMGAPGRHRTTLAVAR